MQTISLREVLADMDSSIVKGRIITFSIGFIQKDGTYTFLPRALKCGLKFKIKGTDKRGVVPVDKLGKDIAHRYPVSIFSIVDFNGKRVFL